MLDPQAKFLLQLMVERAVPAFNEQTPEQARQAYLMRKGFTQPEPPQVSLSHDHLVPMNGTHIKIREFRPADSTATQVLPALVYYHGGGWVIGDIDTHDVLCRQLCQASGCAVFSVDYRLAPEHVVPAAYDDAQAAFQWVAASAKHLHIAADRIAVGGDSAGGNLAAALCLRQRAQAGPMPVGQLLVYPGLGGDTTIGSYVSNAYAPMLTTAESAMYFGLRTGGTDRASTSDPELMPLKAADFRGMPPAFVVTADIDPLRDDGRIYVERLQADGVAAQKLADAATHRCQSGQPVAL